VRDSVLQALRHQRDSVLRSSLLELADKIHLINKPRWWCDLRTGKPIKRNVGELLMLCVSELSEALEGHRKGLQDDKLPHRPMIEVELADCIIRCLDMGSGLGLDVPGALIEKLEYNRTREDHQAAHRKRKGGKKY